MKKKLLFRCLTGAPIGVAISLVITIIISFCTGNGDYYPAPPGLVDLCGNTVTAVTVQMVCSLLFGAVAGGSSVIWETEKWNLLKQTLIHFAVLSVSSFPVAYILHWIPHNVFGALIYVAVFVLIYLIMWISIYFSIKVKIKKMNKQLQEMQNEEE